MVLVARLDAPPAREIRQMVLAHRRSTARRRHEQTSEVTRDPADDEQNDQETQHAVPLPSSLKRNRSCVVCGAELRVWLRFERFRAS